MDTSSFVSVSPARDSAAAILHRHIMPIPIPFGEKNPNRPGWERERYRESDLGIFAERHLNIGMLLGHVVDSDGQVLTDRFIDVDLDTAEAIRIAPFYLPPTKMVWGRESKPRSHYGYRLEDFEAGHHAEYRDPTARKLLERAGLKAMLCELRYTGKQTLAPGSVNRSGDHAEVVRWELDGDGEPSPVQSTELDLAMGHIGAATLLARYWTDGVRHLATLPLAGLLCRGGMSLPHAEHFIRAVCTGAEELPSIIETDRVRCVQDTYARYAQGQLITAAPTLEDFFDARIVAAIRKWLNLSKTAYGGDVGPDGWPLSDIGNAERFAEKWRGQLLYCEDEKTWYWYDGRRWQRDRANTVYVRSVEVVNDFRSLVIQISTGTLGAKGAALLNRGNTTPEQWKKHVTSMSEMRQIRAMQSGAQALLAVLPEEFNADPLLLNVQNGTLELNTATGSVTLRPHNADDRLTMMWGAPYLEDATHPLLDDYLERFFPEADRRTFLEEAAGYSITGLPKRWSVQLLGPTHAGKSMTLHLLHKHAGDYGATLAYTALMADDRGSGGDKPRSDLLGLLGKRIVTIAEIPPGARFDQTLFKTILSGGDRILVRGAHARYGREVEFTFTLWTSGNEIYGPPAKDTASWVGRLAVLKCDHAQPDDLDGAGDLIQLDTENPDLTGAAFLALAVRGFRRVYGAGQGKLNPPQVVRAATSDAREQLDPWTEVIDEMVEISPNNSGGIAKSALWACAKEAWVSLIGPKPRFTERDKMAFESAVERRGGKLSRRDDKLKNRQFWKHVGFMPSAETFCTFTDADWFV